MKIRILLFVFCITLGSHLAADAITITSLAGDKDGFGTGKPLGSLIDYNNETSFDTSDGDFDHELRSSYNWVHTYLLPSDETVVGASLAMVTLDIDDGADPDPQRHDVRLYLDDMEILGAFDNQTDMGSGAVYPSIESIFVLDPSFLPALQDGILNVRVDPFGGSALDGIMIDYAELTITTAAVPEPSTFLLTGIGLIGLIGFNWWCSGRKSLSA